MTIDYSRSLNLNRCHYPLITYLIDAKVMDESQSIWLSVCPIKGHIKSKNKSLKVWSKTICNLQNVFVSSLWKSGSNDVTSMGLNLYDHHGSPWREGSMLLHLFLQNICFVCRHFGLFVRILVWIICKKCWLFVRALVCLKRFWLNFMCHPWCIKA